MQALLPRSDAQSRESAYDVFDDFAGAETNAHGRMPRVGQHAWAATGGAVEGAPGNARIGGGVARNLVDGQNLYLVQRCSDVPWEVGGVFQSADGRLPACVIAVLKDFPVHGFGIMWHPLLSTPGVGGGVPTLLASYWNTVANGAAAPVVAQGCASQSPPHDGFGVIQPETPYRYRMFLNPPYADYLVERLDGTEVATWRTHDPLMASLIGPWVFFETGGPGLTWREAYARTRPQQGTLTYRRTLGGQRATPLGQRSPAAGNFTAAHVGNGGPAGAAVFSARYDGNVARRPSMRATNTAAELELRAETPGHVARVQLVNGSGGVGTVMMDGAFALSLSGHSGTPFLTKPANAGDPWFEGTVRLGAAAGPGLFTGAGSPDGSVTAPVGSLFLRTDGAAGTSLYVKEGGAGSAGWVAK